METTEPRSFHVPRGKVTLGGTYLCAQGEGTLCRITGVLRARVALCPLLWR